MIDRIFDKFGFIITAVVVIAYLFVLLYSGISAENDRIRQAWLDGYRQQQIESLPEVGVEVHKKPAVGLLGKG
jgi:hypothetical protein